MDTLTYKCPSCGAPLVFQGDAQSLQCGSCGNSFPGETVRKVNELEQQDASPPVVNWQMQGQAYTSADASNTKTYSCSSCGAQLMTDATTVATNCAFCGSPSIIPAQFIPGTRPDIIIPFTISKGEAEKKFFGYFKGKKMIPNLFLKGRNQIDEIRQLYVPYWLFSCQADGRMTFNATRVSSMRQGQYMVTRTSHFLIRRAGTLDFKDLPIDANSQVNNDITETLEPYQTAKAIHFSPETLSGAMANRADVSSEQCQQRANQRVTNTMDAALRATVQGYSGVTTRSAAIDVNAGTSSPALFPIWIITTKKEGKTYTFAINGQTGELTCDIPYSRAKFASWMFGIAAAVSAVGFAISLLLVTMGVIS
ncbi:MAG: hypothetical protein AB9880_00505 [Christensenellales bacterium]